MKDSHLEEAIYKAADYVRTRTHIAPEVGIILGSGLSGLAARVQGARAVPYAGIPNFPRSTVSGHVGQLVLGTLAGVPVCLMQGRAHYYEGYSSVEITFPIRVMRRLGAETLIVTNAAGGIKPDLAPGDLMAITDHINVVGLAGHHPLRGPNDESLGPRFPDMSRPYAPELLELLREEARAQGVTLREGVYVMVSGPSFETPAEVRMIRALGGDAVGMSTAPEVVVARHAGMRVLGISLISNVAIDSVVPDGAAASHKEVLEAGELAAPRLASLIEGVLRRLSRK